MKDYEAPAIQVTEFASLEPIAAFGDNQSPLSQLVPQI